MERELRGLSAQVEFLALENQAILKMLKKMQHNGNGQTK